MASFSWILVVLVTLSMYRAVSWAKWWRQQHVLYKSSGIKVLITPLPGNAGYLWAAIYPLLLPLFKLSPWLCRQTWFKAIHPTHCYAHLRDVYDDIGSDVYLQSSPGDAYFCSSNAEVNAQIAARPNDFEKPIEVYQIVDMYGPSVLTTLGGEWKRQHKVIAPAFSEKSNATVWSESLRQAKGMLDAWARGSGSSVDDMRVEDATNGTQQVALHVISGAGFGVPQMWHGDVVDELGTRKVPGFNTKKLLRDHHLTFLGALTTMLHSVMWMALLPVWLLEISPFQTHKNVLRGFREMEQYFHELTEYRRQLDQKDEADGAMDIMGALVRASEKVPEKIPSSTISSHLTEKEIISNAWIMLFAGHETTANAIHFAFVFLAMNREAQVHLQKDLDMILNGRKASELTYAQHMKPLYNSMPGAVLNEALRLMPATPQVAKHTRDRPQQLTMDGKTILLPANTFVHLDVVGVARNPRYWPHSASKITNENHDMNDFVPERWLVSRDLMARDEDATSKKATDGLETVSFEGSGLYVPPPGAFLPFSLGPRGCPGKRFAQTEITAVLATVFSQYSAELDVRAWASDEEVAAMNLEQRRAVYKLAVECAREKIRRAFPIITLKMQSESVPLRFVRRGKERFGGL